MGPSGSGKSSLLYLLGGLDRPTKGEIEINGQQISKLNEDGLARYRQKTVGFIFQSFNLVSNLTALENVAYPLRFAGVDNKKRLARASELLKQVGLYDRAPPQT
jgi:putative ABC transport system ATP-binding protein